MDRRILTTMVCALLAAITASCGACRSTTRRDGGTVEAPRLAKPSELTASERQWGIGPRRGPDVTYQPDVVLIDEGPDAVVGLSSNGVEWIIDGSAAHAKELLPGKILFATSRVVGRILRARREGDDVAVIVGPVELTEVVSDLTVQLQTPIDFAEAITYPAFPPGLSAATPQGASAQPTATYTRDAHLAFVHASGRLGHLLRVRGTPRQRADPIVSSRGLGIRINVEGDGTHFVGDATFSLAKPWLKVDLVIAGGRITRAVLELHGAAGMAFGFAASTDRGLAGNFEVVEASLPTDLSIPIAGPAFPMTVNLRQGFKVETGWGGKGSLTARADFTASGSYDLGYSNGSFGVNGPTNFKWTVHPLASIGHTSPAHTGMVMAYQTKLIVGIGGYGFATGPFVRLHTGIGISAESTHVTLRGCRNASIVVSVGAGFGYSVPQALVDGINGILRAFNLGAIRGDGGVELAFVKLLDSHTVIPPIDACRTAGS